MNKLVAVTQLALCFVFVFCNGGGSGGVSSGSRPSSLVDSWVNVGGGNDISKIELFKDGTGVTDGATIQWKVENKRLVILSSTLGFTCDYNILDYELTIINDDGNRAIFVRKGKLEEYKAKQEAKKIADAKKAAEKAKASVSTFKDSRDAKSYKKVTIGGTTWMVENLNYAAEGSKCYGNNAGNCEKYGRLYNWATAKTACPTGWHLPSDAEWTALTDNVGGKDIAGTELKSTSGWYNNGNGNDNYGFSALPGGNGRPDGNFGNIGGYGIWWSNYSNDAWSAYYRIMYYNYEFVGRVLDGKAELFSVRCVED
jgi:uncharacterized protein (TIGR02145 family)